MVRAVLDRAEIAIPFFANRLEWQGGDRWRLTFPYSQSDCRVSGANCKCSHGVEHATRLAVAIGDGRSDFCMATRADFVIAKGTLAGFCRSRGLEHQSLTGFEEATAHFARWLASDGLHAGASATSAV